LAASKVWSGLTARWCRCSAMGLGRDVEAGMVSMAVWHGSERQRQCVRCGRVLSGGAVSSGQVVRRVQCGGSSGCMVRAMCGNVAVEWCGAESGGNVQWSGWSSRGSLLRGSSSAWLLLWHLAGFDGYLACACLPDTIHIPIALQFTLVAPVDVPCGGCLPVQ